MIVIFFKYCYGDAFKKDKIDKACGMQWKDKECRKSEVRRPYGRQSCRQKDDIKTYLKQDMRVGPL
jgi:hypothetical protein